jgi:ADP-heptose:LPS heptosyltransferase
MPIQAERELAQTWAAKVAAFGPGLRVGLNWAGNPNFDEDDARSMSLRQMGELLCVQGVRFFSLQKNDAAEQLRQAPELGLVDFADELLDFADTAALIANLDLVITVDTAVAHLAGSMGKPVWVLLRSNGDWRWLLGRADSPWYPTMRLFRQPAPRQWAPVIATAARELQTMAADVRTRR